MKYTLLLSCIGLFTISCGTVDLSSPLDAATDPLKSPNRNVNTDVGRQSSSEVGMPELSPGTWVETAMPDAGFYRGYPLFGGKPDQSLPVASAAKIISYRGSYAKVELESGKVGYVRSGMLIEQVEYYDEPEPAESAQPVPVASSSDPVPLSEDDILLKIKERERLKAEEAAAGAGGFIAPEPEVQGLSSPKPSESSSAPVEVPAVPSAPGVAVPEVPSSSPEIIIESPELVAPTSGGLAAPTGDQIPQSSALEFRKTEF